VHSALFAFMDEGRESAEFAIAVRSDLKGRGLGWLMMQLIIEYGRSAGFERIYGQILQENTIMLKMCKQLGFETRINGADPSVREVSLTMKRFDDASNDPA
jgi:RimJ/RimL family protein N-acetyltransferase